MEILITGYTGFVTNEFIQETFPNDHVLLTTIPELGGKRIKNVRWASIEDSNKLNKLAESYEFEQTIYFSNFLNVHGNGEGELERLRSVLNVCRKHKTRLLYIAGPEGGCDVQTGETILATAAESLCMHYRDNADTDVRIIRVPYLYNRNLIGGDYFKKVFEEAENGKVTFSERKEQSLFFLNMEDLSVLIPRIFDKWPKREEILSVQDTDDYTIEDFGELLKKEFPNTEINYGYHKVHMFPKNDDTLKQRYGWKPSNHLINDLSGMIKIWKERNSSKISPIKAKFNKFIHSKALMAAEIAATFIISELLVHITQTTAQFKMIDFRLMFVMIISTIFGMGPGIIAGALASFSLVMGYVRQGSEGMHLFYDASNWLPFIMYFVVGAVCGYINNKNKEDIKFVKMENGLLRNRLKFVTRLYNDTLEDKRLYHKQILGRKDSFGKIYNITKHLDDIIPQELYRKTINVLEDVLENKSVCIYSLGENTAYARLEATSSDIEKTIPKSLRMEEHAEEISEIESEGIFVNRSLDNTKDMYMAGIRKDGRLAVLISVKTCDESQMNLYYQNLFKILTGLVETSLLRALEYQVAAHKKQYVSGTCFMKEKYFMERLCAVHSMKESRMTDYLLIEVERDSMGDYELSEKIESCIRNNDYVGKTESGKVYIMLNQANEKHLPIIEKRMNAVGLRTKIINIKEISENVSEQTAELFTEEVK